MVLEPINVHAPDVITAKETIADTLEKRRQCKRSTAYIPHNLTRFDQSLICKWQPHEQQTQHGYSDKNAAQIVNTEKRLLSSKHC